MESLPGSWLQPLVVKEGAILRLEINDVGLGELGIDVDHGVLARN